MGKMNLRVVDVEHAGLKDGDWCFALNWPPDWSDTIEVAFPDTHTRHPTWRSQVLVNGQYPSSEDSLRYYSTLTSE